MFPECSPTTTKGVILAILHNLSDFIIASIPLHNAIIPNKLINVINSASILLYLYFFDILRTWDLSRNESHIHLSVGYLFIDKTNGQKI